MTSEQGCLGLISEAVKHWKNLVKRVERDCEIWHLGGVCFMTLAGEDPGALRYAYINPESVPTVGRKPEHWHL